MADHKRDKGGTEDVLEKLKEGFQNFDAISILRGAQLTIVGAVRAFHNPQLFQSDIYRQAWLAVGAGIAIKVLVEVPVFALKIAIRSISLVLSIDMSQWEGDITTGLNFLNKTILQMPYVLISMLHIFSIGPHLDDMFMLSLEWVDRTYAFKHKSDSSLTLRNTYYGNLKEYPTHSQNGADHRKTSTESARNFITNFGFRTLVSLAAYLLSFVPIVGKFALPATSFFTFKEAVGLTPASIIFSIGLLLPRQYLALFLQTYYGSRNLMRQLLVPYLKRIRFSREQQRRFFREREGVFFGFGIGFYFLLKVPIFGVLIYGIAEASTAYLITKVTDPPPAVDARESFAQSQTRWTNKKEFFQASLSEAGSGGINTLTSDSVVVNLKREKTEIN